MLGVRLGDVIYLLVWREDGVSWKKFVLEDGKDY